MIERDIEDYSNRILDLLKEARDHGVTSYCILYSSDPISRTSQTRYVRTADHILAMGLLQVAQLYLQDEYFEDDEEGEGTEA